MVASIIIPLVAVLGLAVLAAAVVFFATKLRSGEPLTISFRFVLTAYFYLLSIAGLVVLLVGLSGLLNAGLGVALGRDFSYYRPPGASPVPLAPPPGPGTAPAVPVPTPEERQAEAQRQQERQVREGLLQGISMALVGGFVWVTHTLGRRRMETVAERREGFLHMGYLVILLAICSLVGLISLVSGVSDTLRFYLLQPVNEFDYRSPPGSNAAAAIVFVSAWAYYLLSLLRNLRQRQQA